MAEILAQHKLSEPSTKREPRTFARDKRMKVQKQSMLKDFEARQNTPPEKRKIRDNKANMRDRIKGKR